MLTHFPPAPAPFPPNAHFTLMQRIALTNLPYFVLEYIVYAHAVHILCANKPSLVVPWLNAKEPERLIRIASSRKTNNLNAKTNSHVKYILISVKHVYMPSYMKWIC